MEKPAGSYAALPSTAKLIVVTLTFFLSQVPGLWMNVTEPLRFPTNIHLEPTLTS